MELDPLISHLASSTHSNIDVLLKLVQSQHAELLKLRQQLQELQHRQLQQQQPALQTAVARSASSSSSAAATAAAAPSSPHPLLSQAEPLSGDCTATRAAPSSPAVPDDGSISSSPPSEAAAAARLSRKRGREKDEERKETTPAAAAAADSEELEILMLSDDSREEGDTSAMWRQVRQEAEAIAMRVALQADSGSDSPPLPPSAELERLLEVEESQRSGASAASRAVPAVLLPASSPSPPATQPTTTASSSRLHSLAASGSVLPPPSASPSVPAASVSAAAAAVPKAASDLDRFFDELEEEHDRFYRCRSKQAAAEQQAQQAFNLAEQRDHAAALPLFTSAIALTPPELLSPRLVRGRLTCCARLHDDEGAKAEAQRLWSRWPSSLSAFLLGTVMARTKSFDEAVTWLREAERRRKAERDSEADRGGPEEKQQEEKEGKERTGDEAAVHGETEEVSLQQIEDSIRMVEAKRRQQARRQHRRLQRQTASGRDDEIPMPALEGRAVVNGPKHVTFAFASSQSTRAAATGLQLSVADGARHLQRHDKVARGE